MEKLRECPFCGGEAELCDGEIVQCTNEFCQVSLFKIKAWNTRVIPEGYIKLSDVTIDEEKVNHVFLHPTSSQITTKDGDVLTAYDWNSTPF